MVRARLPPWGGRGDCIPRDEFAASLHGGDGVQVHGVTNGGTRPLESRGRRGGTVVGDRRPSGRAGRPPHPSPPARGPRARFASFGFANGMAPGSRRSRAPQAFGSAFGAGRALQLLGIVAEIDDGLDRLLRRAAIGTTFGKDRPAACPGSAPPSSRHLRRRPRSYRLLPSGFARAAIRRDLCQGPVVVQAHAQTPARDPFMSVRSSRWSRSAKPSAATATTTAECWSCAGSTPRTCRTACGERARSPPRSGARRTTARPPR